METIESIDRECAALGGLFQQVVNDMKTGVPHYEDFISKAGKLHTQLKNTILCLGAFLDTFQKIADSATNTKGATREIGACLTRIVIRHKSMEARLKTLSSALLDCLVLPLQEKMEEWKKVANNMDKEHSKEYKKLRQELKKKTDAQQRLVKKHSKSKKPSLEYDPKVENSLQEVNKSVRGLYEVEKSAVRRVLIEERSRYCTFVACLKPVLGEEISMVSELQQLEEVKCKLDKNTEDPFKLPEASEQVLSDLKNSPVSGEGSLSVPAVSSHYSPPASPSSLGSRKSSMCSISSAGSSSTGSNNSPSHQQHLTSQQARRQGLGNPLVAPMRLSSISSQDSGFTSQDTLFLRPGSPGSGSGRLKTPDGELPDSGSGGSGGGTPSAGVAPNWGPTAVPPMTDRPHTISTAYEKGHSRPSLQPYTFAPPYPGGGTIPEEREEGEQPCKVPPQVPRRTVSEDRPQVPGKTPAAMRAGQRISQQTDSTSNSVPDFSCHQPDMVVPQPVYMNMRDLAALSKTGPLSQGCEPGEPGGLDMKTPTQEDQGSLATEDSGYASQLSRNSNEDQDSGMSVDGQVPAPAKLLEDNKYRSPTRGGFYGSLQRPFSFTPGVQTHSQPSQGSQTIRQSEREFSEALGALQQLGMSVRSGTLLRRSSSQSHAGAKPAPPTRRTPSVCSADSSPPPAPPDTDPMSNSTTPRGSMEFLPPPPPHLLANSDDEEPLEGVVEAVKGPSVKELQRRIVGDAVQQQQNHQHNSHSPSTLKRAQSLTCPPTATLQQDRERTQLMARLDTVLSTPPRGPHPHPKPQPQVQAHGQAQNDQIYAPVAALQQKIQQQQQARLAHGPPEPSLMPHPPGPTIQTSHNNNYGAPHSDSDPVYASSTPHIKSTFAPQSKNRSPEGEQYGFGMQFHQQSQHFHQQNQTGRHTQNHHLVNHNQYAEYPLQHQQHLYHDQLMSEVDPTLGQRPHPPNLSNQSSGWAQHPPDDMQDQVSAQMRVRQWIESRTVTDVRKIRPILNQEIHRGFLLRKPANGSINDRSQPRF